MNGVGLVLTVFILVSMVVLKFGEGGWITIFVTGSLMLVAGDHPAVLPRTQKQLSAPGHPRGGGGGSRADENHRGRRGAAARPPLQPQGPHGGDPRERLQRDGPAHAVQRGAAVRQGREELLLHPGRHHRRGALQGQGRAGAAGGPREGEPGQVRELRAQPGLLCAAAIPWSAPTWWRRSADSPRRSSASIRTSIFFGGRIVFKEETVLTRDAVQLRHLRRAEAAAPARHPVRDRARAGERGPGARLAPTLARAETTYASLLPPGPLLHADAIVLRRGRPP